MKKQTKKIKQSLVGDINIPPPPIREKMKITKSPKQTPLKKT